MSTDFPSNPTPTIPTPTIDDLISVATHAEEELEEALAGHRLTRPSYLVLQALAAADGHRLNQRELVRRVRRTAGTMSVRLGRLERAHLIAREPDPENRRSVTVTLTGRGVALAGRARPDYERRVQRLLEPLDPDARAQVGEALGRWLAFFEPGEGMAPRLGVAVATAAVAKRMRQAVGLQDVPGVLVLRVAGDSPAAGAGLVRGDLITGAGDVPVSSIGDLQRAVQAAEGQLALQVLRGADPRTVHVELPGEARPVSAAGAGS